MAACVILSNICHSVTCKRANVSGQEIAPKRLDRVVRHSSRPHWEISLSTRTKSTKKLPLHSINNCIQHAQALLTTSKYLNAVLVCTCLGSAALNHPNAVQTFVRPN